MCMCVYVGRGGERGHGIGSSRWINTLRQPQYAHTCVHVCVRIVCIYMYSYRSERMYASHIFCIPSCLALLYAFSMPQTLSDTLSLHRHKLLCALSISFRNIKQEPRRYSQHTTCVCICEHQWASFKEKATTIVSLNLLNFLTTIQFRMKLCTPSSYMGTKYIKKKT